MAEPIPSATAAVDNAAAADADDETSQNLPANAEDRKAAAALNSLNAHEMSQENGETSSTKQPSAADQEALGQAMSRLEIASGVGKKKDDVKKAETKKEVETKKKVKVAAEDVTLLVEELDLSKTKATELLRSHDGNAVQAIKAFITPAIKV